MSARAARDQRNRGVEPRVRRGWTYALLRSFTTVVSRDVCVNGVVNDVFEGRAAIYVDLLGYDEVSHHSGPERSDTMAVLRDLDRQIGRIERALRWAPRPYHLVVLSDHGQTQGATFEDRAGETLAELVGRLCGDATSGDPDAEKGRTESTAWLRRARGDDEELSAPPASSAPIVLASGNLGLVTLPGDAHRLTREEIEARHPTLIDGLVAHPEVGFVLVATANGGSVVLGPGGSRSLADGEIVGDDPLAPFGPRALEQVQEVDSYRDGRGSDDQQSLRPRARRGGRVRGPGRVTRWSRRTSDPSVPAVPGRAVRAVRADLHLGRHASRPEVLAGRGRPARDHAMA